jgi:hypothetical protein
MQAVGAKSGAVPFGILEEALCVDYVKDEGTQTGAPGSSDVAFPGLTSSSLSPDLVNNLIRQGGPGFVTTL